MQADGNEIKDLAHEIRGCVTQHDLHEQVNGQIKPLVTAISSLEKAIQIQDVSTKHTQSTFTDKMATLERLYREYIDHKASNDEQIQMALNKDKLCTVVEEIMHLRRWGEVTPVTVENAVQQQTEYLLNKMGIMGKLNKCISQRIYVLIGMYLGESIRLEVITSTREEFTSIQHQMDQKISDVSHMAKEISEKHMKTRKAVKELSLNVATALSKKVDLKDYKAHLQYLPHHHPTPGHQSTSSLSSGAGGGGGRAGYQSVVSQSRSLLNTSQDNNMLSSAAESDPNREFDFLLQSMKSDTNRRSYHEGLSRRHNSSSSNELSDHEEPVADEVDSLEGRRGGADHSLNQSGQSRHTAASGRPLRGQSSSPLRRSRAHFHTDDLRSSLRSTSATGKRGTKVTTTSEVESIEALQKTVYSLTKEVEHLKATITQHLSNRSSTTFNPTLAAANDLDKLDWRLALGEVSMNLRREVSDKASREELFSVLRTETEALDRKIGVSASFYNDRLTLLTLNRRFKRVWMLRLLPLI